MWIRLPPASQNIKTMKKIFFYIKTPLTNDPIITDYKGTVDAIRNEQQIIKTTSIANVSMYLIELGYDIYLVNEDDKCVSLRPGMWMPNGKDIRSAHNLLRLFMAGSFNGCFDQEDLPTVREILS